MRCVHSMVECPLTDEEGMDKHCTPLCCYHPEFFENFKIESIEVRRSSFGRNSE